MKNYILILFLLLFKFSWSQTDQVNYHCDFESGNQNMWGPSFSAFTINQEIDIFSFPWNVSGGTGNSGIVTILGQSFGAAASFGTSGVIGSKFTLEGFTTGEVAVDYPVDITITKPQDNTFDQGDLVSLQTDYEVSDSFALETFYPSVGTAKLDIYFQISANASITVCAFGCVTVPIIPSFSTPTITLNIFNVGIDGIWYLGPACAEAIPMAAANSGPGDDWEASPGQNIFPFALPAYEDGCTQIPWQVRYEFLPLEIPDNDFGISGELTVPYVETTDGLNLVNNNLYGTGESTYVHLSLEIFKLLGAILSEVPEPITAGIGEVLSNLSGEFELPSPLGTIYGATLSYNIMSASFNVYITNKQAFNFNPKIYGKYEFPVPVAYTVYNGATAVESGSSSIINCEVGNRIDYYFPCYYADFEITPTYSIVGQFTNRTYDSINFTFEFSALQFGFNLPAIQITPEITIPEICIPIPYPCPSWSNPFRWCTYTLCTPSFTIPAVVFGGFNFNIGPLLDYTFPIADIKYDWFNQTWTLEGFDECPHDPFVMRARVFSANASKVDVNCFGNSTGSIDVTLTNGSAPFSYVWTNGAVSQDLTGLPANSYQVLITDANGCQTTAGATIIQPSTALNLSLITDDKNCNGGVNDGSIDVLTQGGTSPYSFSWSNGATSEDITNLNVGTYTLTTTDSKGCTALISGTINQPSPLSQTAATSDVNCRFGSDGAINASPVGGVQPYTYSWTNTANATVLTSEDISSLVAANYTLLFTDANGCQNSGTYTINQPATLPSLTLAQSSVSCFGGVDGGVNLTPSGGTPGYTFSWVNGANQLLPYTSEDLTNVPADSYSVEMTDSKGCVATGNIAVTQPAAAIGHAPILTHINCFGDATGAINPVITGGTAPYTYAWSNGATTSTLTNIVAGTYTLNVTDFRGCTSSYTYTLTQPNAALAIALTPNTIDCFGNSTGTVISDVTGGTTPYTYNWSNGQTTPSITGVVAGTYTLNIIDNKGCLANASATITQPAAPLTSTNTFTNVNCYDGSNGTIDLTVNGGTAPYSYQWWDGTNQLISIQTQDLSNLAADTYVVMVTDARNCVIYDSITITQPLAPLALSSTMDDVNCFGASDGALDLTVTGGTTTYTYSWSSGQTSQDITAVPAGNYTVTVTDFNGCIASGTYTVSQPLAALSTAIVTDPILCNGFSTGTATSTTVGGTEPYTYSWSNGATTPDISNVAAGPYTLTVTDSKGCFTFTGTVIQQPAAPLNVVPTIVDASCYEYSDGSIVINITGGTQPYAFTWGNNNEIILNNPSETITNLSASDYLIRVTDVNGCVFEQIVTVGQPTPFLANLTVTDALCFGGNTGSIQSTVTGGTTPYTYSWSDGQTTPNATNLVAGTYGLLVVDDQGCRITDTATVNQPLQLISNVTVTPISCIDQTDANIHVVVAGGIQPYSYLWSTGATTNQISDLDEGLYTLTVTDAQACVLTLDVIVDPVSNECVNPVNTITPNGDDYNDTWIIENLDLYPNMHLQVFNKWGNLVHEQKGLYQPWDGSSQGQPLPSEVYYYIIDLFNDQSNQYTGSITIIR